jgi:hypothetical protein
MVDRYSSTMEIDKHYGEWVTYDDYKELLESSNSLESRIDELEILMDEMRECRNDLQ